MSLKISFLLVVLSIFGACRCGLFAVNGTGQEVIVDPNSPDVIAAAEYFVGEYNMLSVPLYPFFKVLFATKQLVAGYKYEISVALKQAFEDTSLYPFRICHAGVYVNLSGVYSVTDYNCDPDY